MPDIEPNYTIIVDTREQQPWCFKHHSVASKKLDAGDYSLEGFENILGIERKKSVCEIANNIVENRFKDALERLGQLKYSFLLLEFDMDKVLSYPVGSTLPKRLWDKTRITPTFLLRNILDWNINYNINVLFCGSGSNAEQVAEYIFRRIFYLEMNLNYKQEPNNDTK
jgi:ERCC4-type nuclease